MNEILLFLTLIFLIVYHAWYVKSVGKEREAWMKALMAKDLTDFTTSKLMEEPAEPKADPDAEFVDAETSSDEIFQRMIDKANSGVEDKPEE